MFAYVVTASYPAYGQDKFHMIVLTDGNKHAATRMAEQVGWVVKRIGVASQDEIEGLKDYKATMQSVRDACKRRTEEELKRTREADLQRIQQEEAARRESERRRKEAEERRETAIVRVLGDVLNDEPEPETKGNVLVATICSKVTMFFNQASVNKKDVYTSISMDLSQFEVTANKLPNTARILQRVVKDLNAYLEIDLQIGEAFRQLERQQQSAESQINAIGSRTHVFGGSGDGLLLSWLCAEGAVAEDRKQIKSIAQHHLAQQTHFENGRRMAMMKQRMLEYRAKTGVDLLLSSTGLGSVVRLEIPTDIEEMAQLS